MKEKEMRLEALLLEGLESKRIPLDDDFWSGLQAKSAEIMENPRTQPISPRGVLT